MTAAIVPIHRDIWTIAEKLCAAGISDEPCLCGIHNALARAEIVEAENVRLQTALDDMRYKLANACCQYGIHDCHAWSKAAEGRAKEAEAENVRLRAGYDWDKVAGEMNDEILRLRAELETAIAGRRLAEAGSRARAELLSELRAELDKVTWRGEFLYRQMEQDQTWWQANATGWYDLCQAAWSQRDAANRAAERAEAELSGLRAERETLAARIKDRDVALQIISERALMLGAERETLGAEFERLARKVHQAILHYRHRSTFEDCDSMWCEEARAALSSFPRQETDSETRLRDFLVDAVGGLRAVRAEITTEAMDTLNLAGWCEGVDDWLADPALDRAITGREPAFPERTEPFIPDRGDPRGPGVDSI